MAFRILLTKHNPLIGNDNLSEITDQLVDRRETHTDRTKDLEFIKWSHVVSSDGHYNAKKISGVHSEIFNPHIFVKRMKINDIRQIVEHNAALRAVTFFKDRDEDMNLKEAASEARDDLDELIKKRKAQDQA